MSTLRQLAIKKVRRARHIVNSRSGLEKCPQKSGICTKVTILTPKKPCSARRAICYVRLSNRRIVICRIPGTGHTLKKYSKILVRGGRPNDLPAIRYTAIRRDRRGDFAPLEGIKSARSKYGVKNRFRVHRIRIDKGGRRRRKNITRRQRVARQG